MPYSHLANSRHAVKRISSKHHVIAVVFNPLRFQSRYNLFREFQDRVEAAGATLWVVELAFGDRPYELTTSDNPRHIQFRTSHEIWHKERMINEAVARLPHDWEYVSWVDADVTFVNHDWVHETVQQLQHYQIVQMFTHAIDIGPNGEPAEQFEGFCHSHVKGRTFVGLHNKTITNYGGKHWHPGYCWGYRRDAWNIMGGLLDINIVGGGDHQMAYGLIGRIADTIPVNSTEQYSRAIHNWQTNAMMLRQNIGVVPGTVCHHFHGTKVKRGYHSRWRILTDNDFDPIADLRTDWHRMLMLNDHKPILRDQLRSYFRQRNEDSIG